MRLGILDQQAARPWNYGCAAVLVLGLLFSSTPATAQQGSQPGVDVRQLERRFETQDTAQAPGGRPGIAVPRVARPDVQADPRPLFVLRNVLLTGARAIAPERLATAYQPLIGKKVSQADLARSPAPSATSTALTASISAAPSSRRRTLRTAGSAFRSSRAAFPRSS